MGVRKGEVRVRERGELGGKSPRVRGERQAAPGEPHHLLPLLRPEVEGEEELLEHRGGEEVRVAQLEEPHRALPAPSHPRSQQGSETSQVNSLGVKAAAR